MVAKDDKEKQAQNARTNKETSQHGTDSRRSDGFRQSSQAVRGKSLRTCRTDWQADYSIAQGILISGGILRQLIQQTKDRLAEADACITWYEEEKQKLQGYLAELEGLAEQNPESPREQIEKE